MQLDPICIKYDEAVHIEGLAPAPHSYQRVETATIPRDVLRILPGRAQGRLHKDPGSPTRGWQDRGFRASSGMVASVVETLMRLALFPLSTALNWCDRWRIIDQAREILPHWTVEIEQGVWYIASGLAEMYVMFISIRVQHRRDIPGITDDSALASLIWWAGGSNRGRSTPSCRTPLSPHHFSVQLENQESACCQKC